MSALWASFGIGASIAAARTERQKAALQADLKYLYSSFTKIPCLKLSPDWRARLIRGYEEFLDSAVPLYVFKNVQALRGDRHRLPTVFGWDRLSDQLRSLTIKRAALDDPADVLIDIVLDDMDKRRRRSVKDAVISHRRVDRLGQPEEESHAALRRAAQVHVRPWPHRMLEIRTPTCLLALFPARLMESKRTMPLGRPAAVASRVGIEEPKSPAMGSRPRSHFLADLLAPGTARPTYEALTRYGGQDRELSLEPVGFLASAEQLNQPP